MDAAKHIFTDDALLKTTLRFLQYPPRGKKFVIDFVSHNTLGIILVIFIWMVMYKISSLFLDTSNSERFWRYSWHAKFEGISKRSNAILSSYN